MSSRLDQEREVTLQPKRIEYAKEQLEALGIEIIHVDKSVVEFLYKGNKGGIFAYSGWWSCKGLGSDRGIEKLLSKIKSLR